MDQTHMTHMTLTSWGQLRQYERAAKLIGGMDLEFDTTATPRVYEVSTNEPERLPAFWKALDKIRSEDA